MNNICFVHILEVICYCHVDNAGLPKLEVDPTVRTPQSFKAGSKMLLNVDFTGVPKAKYEWFFNDSPLSAGPKVSTEGSDSYTCLTVSDLTQHNAGQYKLKVTNKAGSSEAVFAISVRGMLFWTNWKNILLWVMHSYSDMKSC